MWNYRGPSVLVSNYGHIPRHNKFTLDSWKHTVSLQGHLWSWRNSLCDKNIGSFSPQILPDMLIALFGKPLCVNQVLCTHSSGGTTHFSTNRQDGGGWCGEHLGQNVLIFLLWYRCTDIGPGLECVRSGEYYVWKNIQCSASGLCAKIQPQRGVTRGENV